MIDEARVEQSSRRNGLPFYRHRAGSGPTLVFLHYWGGSGRTWTDVVERLPSRDVLTMDLRGWGRSRSMEGPFSLRQLADDTLRIIADAGLTDFVLVGHSMGGKVAQLVAGMRPVGLRAVVLVAPGPAKPSPEATPEYRAALSHAYDDVMSISQARDDILTATTLTDPRKTQVVEDSGASADGAATEWPLRGIAEDVTDAARDIDVRVLVVAAEHDRVEPVAVLRSNLLPYLSDAELVVVPASGHLIPLESPDALADALRAVLSALASDHTGR